MFVHVCVSVGVDGCEGVRAWREGAWRDVRACALRCVLAGGCANVRVRARARAPDRRVCVCVRESVRVWVGGCVFCACASVFVYVCGKWDDG